MIHLIYIYFIINAFIVGLSFKDDKKILGTICLVIGLPALILALVYSFIRPVLIWIENNSLLLGWYRLYCTNYFSKMDKQTIDVRSKQYHGKYKTINANRYQRFFLRQIDKKYKYGITKED